MWLWPGAGSGLNCDSGSGESVEHRRAAINLRPSSGILVSVILGHPRTRSRVRSSILIDLINKCILNNSLIIVLMWGLICVLRDDLSTLNTFPLLSISSGWCLKLKFKLNWVYLLSAQNHQNHFIFSKAGLIRQALTMPSTISVSKSDLSVTSQRSAQKRYQTSFQLSLKQTTFNTMAIMGLCLA